MRQKEDIKVRNEYHLTAAQKSDMISSIQTYFLEEKGEEIGELAAGLLLDFFTQELASTFYNMGIHDAHTYLSGKLEDMFEIEK